MRDAKTGIIELLKKNKGKKFTTKEIAKKLKIKHIITGNLMRRMRGYFRIHWKREMRDITYWHSKRINKKYYKRRRNHEK